MSGSNSYWLLGDGPLTPVSPSPPPMADSSHFHNQESSRSSYNGLHITKPTAQRSPTFVAINADSSISWVAGRPVNANVNPVDVMGVIAGPITGSQPVSVVQHVPPTHERHYSGASLGNESVVKGVACSNNLVTSSTSDSDLTKVPSEPVNYRSDVKLDDKALVTISTKELNRRLKKQGISKGRQKEIKCERRTLKNRGYASNCRISREKEEKRLEREIFNMRKEIDQYPPLDQVEQEYTQWRENVKNLKIIMNITDDSEDDSLSDSGIQSEIKEEEDDFTSTDQENEEDEEDVK